MRPFLAIAAGFLAVAAAMALPCWLAGFPPDGLGVGLPLAGFVLAVLAAALFPRAEIAPETPENRPGKRDGALPGRRVPAEGGTSPYGPETGATGL